MRRAGNPSLQFALKGRQEFVLKGSLAQCRNNLQYGYETGKMKMMEFICYILKQRKDMFCTVSSFLPGVEHCFASREMKG